MNADKARQYAKGKRICSYDLIDLISISYIQIENDRTLLRLNKLNDKTKEPQNENVREDSREDSDGKILQNTEITFHIAKTFSGQKDNKNGHIACFTRYAHFMRYGADDGNRTRILSLGS